MKISFMLNGRPVTEDVPADQTLFSYCREHALKSVKCGCETSSCGLCTVWMDDEPVLSCSVLMARVDGHSVTTLEGVGAAREEFARCMAEEGAEQCGFCSPGFILTAVEILESGREYTDDQLRKLLSGHLCRCTGYENILRAVKKTMYRRLGKSLPEEV